MADPTPAATTTTEDRSTAFRAVEGGNQMQSGERLLVEAYAAIWVIILVLVLLTWRKQRKIDDRVASLEAALAAHAARESKKKGG